MTLITESWGVPRLELSFWNRTFVMLIAFVMISQPIDKPKI